MSHQIIQPELTWTGERFERDVQIKVNSDGVIEDVGQLNEQPTQTLTNRALIPGFINAHSHAFQRGLRGRGETFPEGAGSFWSWREAMYDLVQRMDEELIYTLSKQAFTEMLDAGVTTVGEFHYLHHDETEAGYAFDEIVLKAAADAGIRIVLLNVCYMTGGLDQPGQPLEGGQKRFGSPDLDTFWHQFDTLRDSINHNSNNNTKTTTAMQSLGVAAHSIRAMPIEHIQHMHEEATRRHVPFHMHVEEQPKEIDDCVHRYGKPPMALLNEHLQINPMFTAVHCTHTADADMDDFLSSGGKVCICPLTEANLGDGLAHVPQIHKHGGHITLGTDSNARIDMIEEMRWLEYGQRLAGQCRGVITDPRDEIAPALLNCATTNGARALGTKAGAIKRGSVADFVSIHLETPTLMGWDDETLLAAILCGASGSDIMDAVCVAGKWQQQRTRADNGICP